MAELESSKEMEKDVTTSLAKWKAGVRVLKFCHNRNPHAKVLMLDTNTNTLSWMSRFHKLFNTRIDITLIQQIRRGQADPKFSKGSKDYSNLETLSLSIDYQVLGIAELRTLCIAMPDHKSEFQDMVDALEGYVKHVQDEEMKDLEGAYLNKQWEYADSDKNGSLSESEIIALLKKMNMTFSREHTHKFFRESDVDNSGTINKEEFKSMLDRLKYRKEIDNLMYLLIMNHKNNAEHVLPPNWCEQLAGEKEVQIDLEKLGDDDIPLEVFNRFATEIQKDLTISHAELRKLDPAHDGKTIGMRAFSAYLNSDSNDIMDSKKMVVYQDMSRPLSHYWCASSHNTYLDGDQLTSNASVQRYISDLHGGCRCVELDCWDGKNDDPMILHGHTATRPIRFEDAIKGIAENAFRTSQYPVILSLENHCNVKQQNVMQEMMKRHFGDKLVCPNLVDNILPPLNSLMGKIILKGKTLGKVKADPEQKSGEETAEEVSDSEDEDDKAQAKAIQHSMKQIKLEKNLTVSEEGDSEDESSTPSRNEEMTTRPQLPGSGGTSEPRQRRGSSWFNKEETPKKEKKAKVDAELSAVTFLGGVKFKSFEQSKAEAKANEMSSFSENKTGKLLNDGLGAQWVEYNARQMSRIYPAGVRVNSSNYDPVPSWCVGSQIVALNYQTDGVEMQLNNGKYVENGRCGYLLKPEYLIDASGFDPVTGPFRNPETIHITIISACQLPKPHASTKGEVIDPFVQLDIKGCDPDNAQFKTEYIEDNGFNPVWNKKFTIRLNAPELALFHFTVYDNEGQFLSPRFIATRAIARSCIRPGLRCINLCDFSGESRGDFRFAKLLCLIEVE